MGLPDDYKLPERYNGAYHVAGDGLAIPVVRHLAEHLLEPLLAGSDRSPKPRNGKPTAESFGNWRHPPTL